MDNYLLVNINLFTMHNTITLVRENSIHSFGHYATEDLAKALVELSKEHETYKIKLHCGEVYSEGIISEIENEEIKLYNMNKLEIEVI